MKKILPFIIFAMSFSACETYSYVTNEGENVNVKKFTYKTLYTVTDTNGVLLWKNVDNELTGRVYHIDNNAKFLWEKNTRAKTK